MSLGTALVQWQDGAELVIDYTSSTLSCAEPDYSATKKECLALLEAVSKLRLYSFKCNDRPLLAVLADKHEGLLWTFGTLDSATSRVRHDSAP